MCGDLQRYKPKPDFFPKRVTLRYLDFLSPLVTEERTDGVSELAFEFPLHTRILFHSQTDQGPTNAKQNVASPGGRTQRVSFPTIRYPTFKCKFANVPDLRPARSIHQIQGGFEPNTLQKTAGRSDTRGLRYRTGNSVRGSPAI